MQDAKCWAAKACKSPCFVVFSPRRMWRMKCECLTWRSTRRNCVTSWTWKPPAEICMCAKMTRATQVSWCLNLPWLTVLGHFFGLEICFCVLVIFFFCSSCSYVFSFSSVTSTICILLVTFWSFLLFLVWRPLTFEGETLRLVKDINFIVTLVFYVC